MASPTWSPTQQVRALLVLHELAAQLAVEARARTLHGCPQLASQLAAVGKRALPQTLCEMTEWSALRLASGREALRNAIGQFTGASPWAERITNEVVTMLRQGERFTDATHRLDDLARAVAAADEIQTLRWLDHQQALMHRYRAQHAEENADAAQEAWSPALDRLSKAAAALSINLPPPPPSVPAPARPGPTLANSSTPYHPSSATDSDSDSEAGGSHALRRRR